MTEKDGPGQQHKAAAEAKTAKVAQENEADRQRQEAEASQAEQGGGTDEQGATLRVGTDQTPERSDDAPARVEGRDATVDPYPAYDEQDLDELRSLGESRNVEINRDVEKAHLIAALRKADGESARSGDDNTADADAKNPYVSYDSMPLEELRKLADGRDVKLDPEVEKAHWITELRAADSGVNTGGGTTV